MCNLYSLTTNQAAMRRVFSVEADGLGNFQPMPAIFPDAAAPVIRRDSSGRREMIPMRWGFPKITHSYVTNARNLGSSYWRHWVENPAYRVLVPATSFSEYHPSQRDERGRKCASWFALKGEEERPLFAFAGLWRPWTGERKKGEKGDFNLFTILTTEANEVVRPIHPKAMPVILQPAAYETWLGGSAADAIALQRPYPAERMRLVFTGGREDSETEPALF